MALTKTVSELIDELSITNIKIYHLMEKDDSDSFSRLKVLNKYRSDLKNALSDHFKERIEVKT